MGVSHLVRNPLGDSNPAAQDLAGERVSTGIWAQLTYPGFVQVPDLPAVTQYAKPRKPAVCAIHAQAVPSPAYLHRVPISKFLSGDRR